MPDIEEQKTAIKKVLIIEDEGDMCLLLNLLLDGQDIEVNHVQSLSAARDYLRREQPSLILLDNRLPDGYGIDFLSFLKNNYPLIKIIMISGIDIEVEDAALEIGADHFLAKPFTKTQLDESISKLLN